MENMKLDKQILHQFNSLREAVQMFQEWDVGGHRLMWCVCPIACLAEAVYGL